MEGSWPWRCLFHQDKGGSDAKCREEQHLIQTKEESVLCMRSGRSEKRWLNQEPELKFGNKQPPKGRTIAVPPGLMGLADFQTLTKVRGRSREDMLL